MKKESQIDIKDYYQYFKEYRLLYKPGNKIVLIGFIEILSVLIVYNNNHNWTGVLFTILIESVVMFALVFAVPYALDVMQLELSYGDSKFEPYSINKTGEGIVVTKGDQIIIYKSPIITRSRLTRNFLGVRLHDKVSGTKSGLLLFLNADFESNNEMMQFFYRSNKFRYTIVPAEMKRSVPYAWGLLSVIPFVGGINGIIMVINGIYKFKSTAYVVLGAIGILFTAAIFFLFYSMRPNFQSKVFADSMQEASKSKLNDLVKSIEFYKLQHNGYPDSLAQLSDTVTKVSVNDPIYTFKRGKGQKEFNYKKLGYKYSLYSSGIDTIPGTKDDIYPSITISDTSKFGLIRE